MVALQLAVAPGHGDRRKIRTWIEERDLATIGCHRSTYKQKIYS